MAGNIASRKVARAARAGGGVRSSSNTSVGYYSILALIIILGVGTVWYSYYERNGSTNYGSTPPLAPIPGAAEGDAPIRNGDHWHEAVGFYVCDKYVDNILKDINTNPYGIYTNKDGIIHIAPFERKYAGHNATLGLFSKAVGLTVTRDSFKLPDTPTDYDSAFKCGDKNGKFVLKEWTNAKDNNTGKQIESNPTDLLLKDNYALALAWVPTDMNEKDIPLPPSASTIDAVVGAEAAAAQQANTAATPSETTQSTEAPTGTTAPTTAPPAQ